MHRFIEQLEVTPKLIAETNIYLFVFGVRLSIFVHHHHSHLLSQFELNHFFYAFLCLISNLFVLLLFQSLLIHLGLFVLTFTLFLFVFELALIWTHLFFIFTFFAPLRLNRASLIRFKKRVFSIRHFASWDGVINRLIWHYLRRLSFIVFVM